MPHHEQGYSNLSNNPNNGTEASEKTHAYGKQAATYVRRIRRAADTCLSLQYRHHWWMVIAVLTPLVYSALFVAAFYETLPQRLEKADVNVHWTYNCTGYTDSTSPFREWTTTCKAGPIATPVSEQELFSAGKKCSMEMAPEVPVSGELGRFSVECQRQEGFETETTDIEFAAALFLIGSFGGLGLFAYYPMLHHAYSYVREIVNNAIGHLESCSECSLGASFGSTDHLPLVQLQLIRGSIRSQLILQMVLAPLFVAVIVVTPNVALLIGSNWPIIVLPCLLMWSHSLICLLSFCSLGRKAFALKLMTYSSWRLHDAAAIKAVYDEEYKKQSFW
ncbi:hypothetical protein AAVH_17764 [Aphelenchoides avenae]|nr:hypothetical protein AAVH_17764 [Aphelenchus avenae]